MAFYLLGFLQLVWVLSGGEVNSMVGGVQRLLQLLQQNGRQEM